MQTYLRQAAIQLRESGLDTFLYIVVLKTIQIMHEYLLCKSLFFKAF